jgi:uncharacterized protein (DUF1015 family)
MAEIRPFRAFRYNVDQVPLQDVLTEPYDKITAPMQERYYAASPYNLIAAEKGRSFADDTPQNNVYTRAREKIKEWIAQKILVQDGVPGIYVYTQEYREPGSHARRERTGFIALGRLEDYQAKIVFPHERTLSGPKTDRLELLRHTHMQTGQLFMLYDAAASRIDRVLEEATRKKAPAEMRDPYEVVHRAWPVSDPKIVRRIQEQMAEQKLVIADGHHRYETALNYRNEGRARSGKPNAQAAYEFAMMTFVNSHAKGLTILPTHRLVREVANFNFEGFRKAVSPFFDWYAYPFQNAEERAASYAEFSKDLESHKHGRRGIGMYAGGGAFYLFLLRRDTDLGHLVPDVLESQRELDVVLLDRLILEKGLGITADALAAEKNVSYERDMSAAIGTIDRGEAQLACLLNPVRVEQVMEIALGGGLLPQKSTDFYPKLLSGIAIYQIEGRARDPAP